MRIGWGLLLAATVVLLDQLTKAWVVAAMPYGAEHEVIPGLFSLVHARNRGIAFGLFGDSSSIAQVALLVVVIGIVLLVGHQLTRSHNDAPAAVGLALVLGGALGNLIDRVLRGEVVDFLDVYVRTSSGELHWPAFNVADAAISVGAVLIIVAELVINARKTRASDPH